jgi:YD repeat-containing protein
MLFLKNERNYTSLKFKSMYRAFLILFLLAGCGGGGTQDNTTTENEDNDSSIDAQTNQRVVRMRYDYDNNGTFEGLSEFFYDTSGRITQERYTYVDDGDDDLHIAGTLQSYLGREDLDNTTTYTYDANGRLQTWEISDNQGATTISYTYNVDDLISRADEVNENSTGAELFNAYHVLEYSGMQLIKHAYYNGSDSSLLHTYHIDYDSSGYVITNQMTSNLSAYESILSYTYLSSGLTDRIDEIAPDASSSSVIAAEYAYNDAEQVTRFDLHTGDFGWERLFDSDGRVSEVQVDTSLDGSVDAVVTIEWEQAVCTPVMLWNARAFVYTKADPTSPYLPGTGYWRSGHCDQGPL